MPWLIKTGTFSDLNETNFSAAIRPRFFLSGDGHGIPPFKWAVKSPTVKAHFESLVRNKQLCAHLELHQDEISKHRPGEILPLELQPLLGDNRVFGWEPNVFNVYVPIAGLVTGLMTDVMGLGTQDFPSIKRDTQTLTTQLLQFKAQLWEIGNPPLVVQAIDDVVAVADRYKLSYKDFIPGGDLAFKSLLSTLNLQVLSQRTEANVAIAQKIQKKIDLHKNLTHIITCGNAHITNNPLQQYIIIPSDGWVDEQAK